MRLGFVGIGAIARHHAQAARAAGAEVAAACARRLDDSPHWPAFFHSAGPVDVRPLGGFLDSGDLDAFIICTPWNVTPALLPVLLRSTKPLLIEKPVALCSADIREAANICTPGPPRFIGFNRRFYEPVQALRARLARGGLRAVTCVISEHLDHHARTTGAAVLPWLLQFTSIHTFDLLHYLLGDLGLVHVRAQRATSDFVGYEALLETMRDVPVHLSVNASQSEPVGLWCRFTDGSVWALSPLETLRVYEGVEIEEVTEDRPFRRFAPKETLCLHADAVYKPGFLNQIRAFLLFDRTTAASLHDAWRALRLVEAVKEQANGV